MIFFDELLMACNIVIRWLYCMLFHFHISSIVNFTENVITVNHIEISTSRERKTNLYGKFCACFSGILSLQLFHFRLLPTEFLVHVFVEFNLHALKTCLYMSEESLAFSYSLFIQPKKFWNIKMETNLLTVLQIEGLVTGWSSEHKLIIFTSRSSATL